MSDACPNAALSIAFPSAKVLPEPCRTRRQVPGVRYPVPDSSALLHRRGAGHGEPLLRDLKRSAHNANENLQEYPEKLLKIKQRPRQGLKRQVPDAGALLR